MKLEQIGMVWEAAKPWETGFLHAQEYFREQGNLEVPNAFVCEDGYRLGKGAHMLWVKDLVRNKYKDL